MNFVAKPPVDPAVATLYNACVAQARQPAFYATLGAPDTLDGRFDLLLLHVVLVMRRLNGHNEPRQELFDFMYADMDRSLREMGVSDIRIGKRMRPLITAFYGRAQAYENAFAADDAALSDALRRNIFDQAPVTPEQLQQLTTYVRRTLAALDAQPTASLLAGQVEFPSPTN